MGKTTGLRNSLGGWISGRVCSSWSTKHHLPRAEPSPGRSEPVIYQRECYQRCLSATAGKVNTGPAPRAGYHLASHKGDTSNLGKPPLEIAAVLAAKPSTIPGDRWHGRASKQPQSHGEEIIPGKALSSLGRGWCRARWGASRTG